VVNLKKSDRITLQRRASKDKQEKYISHRRAAKNAKMKSFLFSVERTENKKKLIAFKLSPLTTI
jgi:hypothetical protein